MTKLSYQTLVDFNQAYYLDDYNKYGGSCFGYVALYFTYILAHRVLYDNLCINYAGLKNALRKCKFKNELQASQSDYVTREYSKSCDRFLQSQNLELLLNHEIAPLNRNQNYYSTLNLADTCKVICEHVESFTDPTLYLLSIFDSKQKHFGYIFYHFIALYLVSPKELHVFNADTGLHIIHLPSNVTKEALGETLLELIFKKNFFTKFLDAHSRTTEYQLTSSREQKVCDPHLKLIKDIIRDHVIYKKDYDDFLEDCLNLNVDEKNYIRRMAYMIDTIRQIHFDQNTNFFNYSSSEPVRDEIELKTFKVKSIP